MSALHAAPAGGRVGRFIFSKDKLWVQLCVASLVDGRGAPPATLATLPAEGFLLWHMLALAVRES